MTRLIDSNEGEPVSRFSLFSCAALLVAACAAAYATAIPGGFVWLDHTEIEEAGYRVRDGDDFAAVWTMPLDEYAFRDLGGVEARGGYWRPLYALGISLDWTLWGASPHWFHVENVLWHAAVVLSLFVLGRTVVGWDIESTRTVFWGTLLFAVHPLGIQSVTWISGRKDSMCALFGVWAVTFALWSADRHHLARRWGFVLLAGLAQLLALGCKELACVVPLFLLGTMIVRRRERNGGWAALVAVGLVTVVWMGLRSLVTGGVGLNAEYPANTLGGNVAGGARLWWYYLGRILWPILPILSDRWPVDDRLDAVDLAAIGGLGVVLLATVVLLWRHPRGTVFWLWFVVWLLPASGLVPLRHVHAERYLYPASWGVLVGLVGVIRTFLPRWRRQVAIGLAVAAVGLGTVTAVENLAWHDDARLFEQAIARDPAYVEGRIALAYHHLEREEYEKSAQLASAAVRDGEDPEIGGYWSPVVAYTNLGLALYHLGRLDEAEPEFTRVVELAPGLAPAHLQLGMIDVQRSSFAAAQDHFERALELLPRDTRVVGNLAFVHLAQGRPEKCVELLEPITRGADATVIDRRNLGSALLLLQRFEEAADQFSIIVEANPEAHGDRAKWAWALYGSRRRGEAVRQLAIAAAGAPDHPVVQSVRRITGLR